MDSSWNNKSVKDLFKVILKLKTVKECEDFFRDLCTLSELKAMSERWAVVQKIQQNIPYRQISEETGASTATITRIAHWLHHECLSVWVVSSHFLGSPAPRPAGFFISFLALIYERF